MYFVFVRYFALTIFLLLMSACSSQNVQDGLAGAESATPRPAHHLPDGHFQNTDTSCDPIRDTMELDENVPTHRTRLHRLPIVRGNEELWDDTTASTATWIGHATYYLKLKKFGILADPIFSLRSSPVQFAGPKRGTPPGRALDSLPQVDLVLITHDHYDHLDKNSIKDTYKRWKNCKFAVPLKVAEILEDWGIPKSQIIELDWWETATVGDVKLTFVPCHHLSRRGIFSSSKNSTLWGSWIIEKDSRKIWFAGDLAMGDGSYYKTIADKFAPVDLSLLPIGSYKPSRYTRVHVSPRQAAQLHQTMQSKQSLAMHWGTFSMVYDRMDDPPKDLAQARKELNITDKEFYVPMPGEIFKLFE